MAEPGWYRQGGGVGYWDGAAWTEYRPHAQGVPTWALVTWSGFMAIFAVELFVTWWVLLCSSSGCGPSQAAVLLGCLGVALAAVGGLLAFGLIRPAASNRVVVAIVMPIAVLGAAALPMLFASVFG